MSDKKNNIIFRFGIVYAIMLLAFGAIITKIIIIQTTEREEWLSLTQNQVKTNRSVRANRGNIYSCDGRLMASSIPTYYIYMDTRVPALHEKNGQLFNTYIDSVSNSLSNYFKDRSASEYKKMITKAYHSGNGNLALYPNRITFAQLKDVKAMPLFNKGRYKSGLLYKKQYKREKPFGPLAGRTIGDIYADEDKGGKSGLEKYFDDQLRGVPGVSVRQKAANKYVDIIEVEPQDGLDIISTIDVDLQDIAEDILEKKLRAQNATKGCVLLMDVKTGEVKICANMTQVAPGVYRETENWAVKEIMHPGSTFKTMSMLVALEKGVFEPTDTIDTESGEVIISNRKISDRPHINDKAFGKITMQEVLAYSSNVGTAKIITENFAERPSVYTDMVSKTKITEPMEIAIPGTGTPFFRKPGDKYWSKSSLAQLSYGYESSIPPIYMLRFYNAIANNGKMIEPIFAKAICKNGETIKTFSTHTVNSSICSSSTLQELRTMLEMVVNTEGGTGYRYVRSPLVNIAGKTGTADALEKGHVVANYASFAGYFPADNPQYTMYVMMRTPTGVYGVQSGVIFRYIAERVMARKTTISTEDIVTENFVPEKPSIKRGKQAAIKTAGKGVGLKIEGEPCEWVRVDTTMQTRPLEISRYLVPRVIGMGAKDAVFAIEQTGMHVQTIGRGRVVEQSITEGQRAVKGGTVWLTLR